MRAFAILLAGLGASFGAAVCGQEVAGDPPPQETVLAAGRDREQRMTIPVTIAGKGPFRFMVDTGAQATVVAREILPQLGLVPDGRATLVGVGSISEVETVALDGLGFAGREFGGLTAPLLDGDHIGADGIIGLDSLEGLRVTIDLRADTLAVSDAGGRQGANGYEIVVRARARRGQMVITTAVFDGVRTAVIIDTGSQVSIGNRALQRRLRARTRTHHLSRDILGTLVESDLGYAQKLEIGPLSLRDIPIAFAESPAFEALGLARTPAVILGMGNLELFDRVAIDFASRRILFDLPADVAAR